MPMTCLARQGVVIRLAAIFVVLLFGGAGSVSGELQHFDLAARPLAAALAEFADRTGMAALIDSELAKDKTSSPVKGRLAADNALQILLAGTGLSFRRVNQAAFAIGPNTAAQAIEAVADPRRRGDYESYFARLQDTSARALCTPPWIDVGAGRWVVQLWIGSSGAIDAVHPVTLLAEEQGAALTEHLLRTRITPPPVGLPQPVTIVLQGDAIARHCAKPTSVAP